MFLWRKCSVSTLATNAGGNTGSNPTVSKQSGVVASSYSKKTRDQGGVGAGKASDQTKSSSACGGVTGDGNISRASSGKVAPLEKIVCHKCGVKGHCSKGCEVKVKCVICSKDSHIADFCAWLHQKKLVATLVGFGGEGLGCFISGHVKDLGSSENNDAVALVRRREGSDVNLDVEQLVRCLAKTYPWRWD